MRFSSNTGLKKLMRCRRGAGRKQGSKDELSKDQREPISLSRADLVVEPERAGAVAGSPVTASRDFTSMLGNSDLPRMAFLRRTNKSAACIFDANLFSHLS
jgi:hypothetical protein